MGNDFHRNGQWFLTKKPGEKQVRPPVFYLLRCFHAPLSKLNVVPTKAE